MTTATWKLLAVPTVIAAAIALAGCTSPAGNGASSDPADSHLTQIIESGTIRVAVLPDGPPWGSMNTSGEYEGIDVDLAKALAASLDAEIEFVSTSDANRIPLLQTDKVDVVVAALTATDTRAQQVEMTIPYASDQTVVLLPKGSAIESYADLSGKTVSVSRGSVAETLMTTSFPDVTTTAFDAVADAIQALKSGKVDAFVTGDTVAYGLIDDDPDALELLEGPPLQQSLNALGVKQGDQLWLNYLNNFLRNYNNSAAANASYQKWLGSELPDTFK